VTKEEVYNFIKHKNIWHEITEHKRVFTMDELDNIVLPYPEADAKNLFIRDDKKRNYYLITVSGKKKVDLNVFREKYNTRRLSFASEKDLMEILKLIPGSVTPLGLLNDKENLVKYYLDSYFINKCDIIGMHPCDNSATLWLKTTDLINILKENGTIVNIVDL